jgi:hypothetical protein
MSNLSLKTLLRAKSHDAPVIASLMAALDGPLTIEDASGNLLMGEPVNGTARVPVVCGGIALGCVAGPPSSAEALGSLLTRLAAREAERHALGAEVLHLYREIHLIDQLSEDLTALLNVSAVAESAVTQARRLIAASSGGILVREKVDGALHYCASFGEETALPATDSAYTLSVLERGVSEIVNVGEMVNAFPARSDDGAVPSFRSLLFAPLRAKQRTVGLIILMNDAGDPYAAGDLKLLNTIALQTAAAIENSIICEEMVGAACSREQLAAIQKELDTARAVQSVLIPTEIPSIPEFAIASVYRPATQVGGDFFQTILTKDGGVLIVIGDVSGKGMPAAMTVSLLVGTIRTLAHYTQSPGEILAAMNMRMLARSAGGFTTCLVLRADPDGTLTIANAGHIAPLVNGVEMLLENGLPLGLSADSTYAESTSHLALNEQLTLMTDGVVEARNKDGELFGFERAAAIASNSAESIAAQAQTFGQEDDITIVTLTWIGAKEPVGVHVQTVITALPAS